MKQAHPFEKSWTAFIIPVLVTPAARCLETSKLTRLATIIDDNVQLEPDAIESFSEFLDTKAEWQRPLL